MILRDRLGPTCLAAAMSALLALSACEEDIATANAPSSEPVAAQPAAGEGSGQSTSSGDYGSALAGAKRSGQRTADKVEDKQRELLKEIDRQLQDQLRSMAGAQEPVPGRLRRTIVCVALLVAGAVAFRLLLPVVARAQVRRTLEQIDPHAAFELRGVSPARLKLGAVTLGSPPWLMVEAVEARYDPIELLVRGRLEMLALRRAQWHIRAREGSADLGFVPRPRVGEAPAQLDVPLRLLEIHDGTVLLERGVLAEEVSIEGVSVTLPVSAATAAGETGSFSLAAVKWSGREIATVHGRLAARQTSPSLLDVRLETSPASIGDAEALAAMLSLAEGARLGGTLALAAEASLHAEGIGPARARLDITDGAVTLPQQSLDVQGIAAAIEFDRLHPLSAPGGQRVTIGSGRLGKVPFRDATIAFALPRPGSLLVEEARWTMGDAARLSASAFSIEIGEGSIDTTIEAQGLSLGYWLPLLTDERATGEGTLSGRIPLILRPGSARPVALGEGYLEAAPGGWIVASDVERLGALLDQSDERFQSDPTMQAVKARLVEALRDYQYDVLRFDVVSGPDGPLLRAFTRGRGRRGESPQEIGGLTVNIHDIDTVLSEVLSLKSALGGTADRALEGFFDD